MHCCTHQSTAVPHPSPAGRAPGLRASVTPRRRFASVLWKACTPRSYTRRVCWPSRKYYVPSPAATRTNSASGLYGGWASAAVCLIGQRKNSQTPAPRRHRSRRPPPRRSRCCAPWCPRHARPHACARSCPGGGAMHRHVVSDVRSGDAQPGLPCEGSCFKCVQRLHMRCRGPRAASFDARCGCAVYLGMCDTCCEPRCRVGSASQESRPVEKCWGATAVCVRVRVCASSQCRLKAESRGLSVSRCLIQTIHIYIVVYSS